jgi:orotidine-5'-phosphate decarboxylase
MSRSAGEKLRQRQRAVRSRLCIGLDPDERFLPSVLRGEANPWQLFFREILAATLPFACAYKLNLSFYEQFGAAGWKLLEQVRSQIPADVPVIADGKRGDVPHTAHIAARTFFEHLQVDAVTVNPLLGSDSVAPFLDYEGRLVFLLARTSNAGARDFLLLPCADGRPLYTQIVRTALGWRSRGELGFVVGATAPEDFAVVRALAPEHWLLVPGVGTQGGELRGILVANGSAPLVINVGRAILYASQGKDFATAAARAAAAFAQDVGFPEA